MMEYKPFLEALLKGYENSYDVEEVTDSDENSPLVAKAHFHVTESQCLIFKEFSMWTAEADEYVFIYYVKKLTDEIAKELIKKTYDVGFPLIHLEDKNFKHQHMCTRLVALFITEEADVEAVKSIKRCKIYKNFNFSLKGWMEMHTAMVNLTDGSVAGNRYSKDTVKFLKELVSRRQK